MPCLTAPLHDPSAVVEHGQILNDQTDNDEPATPMPSLAMARPSCVYFDFMNLDIFSVVVKNEAILSLTA